MRLNYLLLISILQGYVAAECPCEGVVIPGTDQNHCWEVVSVESGGWVGGDIACQKIGGHLGHLNTDIDKLTPYLAQVYSRPILTGIVAGNVETDRFGLVCPNNNYYGLMSEAETSQLLSQTNGSTSTCVFLTNSDFKVLLAPCTTVADALCDRPVDKPDYCNMKINCSVTTTERTTSTQRTTTKSSTPMNTTKSSTTMNTTKTPTTTMTPTTVTTTKIPTESTVKSIATQSTTTVSQSPSTNRTESTASTKITTTTLTGILTSSTTGGSFTNETTKPTIPTIAFTTTSTKVTGLPTSPSPSPTTLSSGPPPIVVPPTECKNDTCSVKIFALCLSALWGWLLLALLALLLLLWFCCCICACWRRNKTREPEQSVIVPPKSKDIEAVPPIIRYSPEPPQPTLPPQPTESTPVIVFPIPFQMSPPQPRREVVEKFTKEIHVIEKEKAIFKDVGTNTDPWIPTVNVVPKKEKEVMPVPLDHDDLADDISIDIPRSPSPDRDTIAPVGDIPVLFAKNSKPNQFDGIRPPRTPEEHQEFVDPPEKDPATVISLTADPRNIRSPPLRQKNVHLPTQEVPSFSPISDISDDVDLEGERKQKPRFPSPPKNKPKFPFDEQSPRGEDDYGNKGPPTRNPSRGDSGAGRPRNGKSPSGDNGPRETDDNSHAPYNGRRSAQPSSGGATPLMKPPDVSIRAARGRLGGVVRAGGGPDDNAPQGWKPWAKTSKNFQPSSYND